MSGKNSFYFILFYFILFIILFINTMSSNTDDVNQLAKEAESLSIQDNASSSSATAETTDADDSGR